MDTRLSADRFVTIQQNERPEADVEYEVRAYTIGFVTEEAFNDSENFTDIVEAAEWQRSHKMAKDNGFSPIKRRRTCTKCGASVIQFEDGNIKDLGTEYPCPK
jgi:hypothetical protein